MVKNSLLETVLTMLDGILSYLEGLLDLMEKTLYVFHNRRFLLFLNLIRHILKNFHIISLHCFEFLRLS